SETTAKAKQTLRERFDLSDEQAQAILDMRLKALAKLEVGKLEEELAALEKKIAHLQGILDSKKKQYSVIKDEILDIKKNNPSVRSTVIMKDDDSAKYEVPTAEEAVQYREGVFVTNNAGLIRFMSQKSYSLALKDMSLYGEAELPSQALTVNNKGTLLAFTNKGNVVRLDVTNIPEKRWREKGVTLASLNAEVSTGEKIAKVLFFNSTPVGELLFFTRQGNVKRSDVTEYASTKSFASAVIVQDDDELINVELVEDEKSILEVTADGQCLIYAPIEVPLQGRKAAGVKGIKLNDGDSVAWGGLIDDEGEIVVVSTTGYAKRVIASTLDIASRYLKGVRIIDLEKSKVKFVSHVKEPYDIAVISGGKTFVVNTEDIRIDTRTTKGKQQFKEGAVTLVTRVN
ncbi:MAG: hypothetical protein MJ193_01275, partial [Clostridia bacterium]|nr:hypothetical protein [Clostridia bacterium]